MLQTVANILSVETYKLGTYIDIKTGTLNRRLRDGTLITVESDRLFHFTEVHDAPFDLFESDRYSLSMAMFAPHRPRW